MIPRVLRARERVSLDAMALRMRLTNHELRELEVNRLETWTVAELQRYVAALGMTLELVALAPDGRREVLS